MSARPLPSFPRRQFLAAGVALLTSLVCSWSKEISIKDVTVACTATKPEPTYAVTLTVENGMSCSMNWITLHSDETFSPHIIHLAMPIAPGASTSFTTTLTGPSSGTSHSFLLMTHCYTEGEDFCNPCRLAVTLELPECDPPIVVEPIIRPRPPRACGVQNGRFFLTTPPALDRKRYVIEASVDMMTWKAVAFSTSPEGMPSMEAFETQAETRDQMLWVQTDLSKQGTYYRVREQSADQRP